MSKKSKVKNSNENSPKKVDYEKIRKRNEKLRKELVHHVKIHKESVKVSGSTRIYTVLFKKIRFENRQNKISARGRGIRRKIQRGRSTKNLEKCRSNVLSRYCRRKIWK